MVFSAPRNNRVYVIVPYTSRIRRASPPSLPPIRIPVARGVRLRDDRLHGAAPSPDKGGVSGPGPRGTQTLYEERRARANGLPGQATGQLINLLKGELSINQGLRTMNACRTMP